MKVIETNQNQIEPPSDLFLAERRRAIVELVQQEGRVAVAELSQRFGVSEVTIRADLQALAEQKLLVRTHGGAVRASSDSGDLALALRRQQQVNSRSRKRAVLARPAPAGSPTATPSFWIPAAPRWRLRTISSSTVTSRW